jgi:predicted GH43/DUF377 family glycosyl hydrolase
MKLEKYKNNPIISPKMSNAWEASVTTNPAAWYDEQKDEFILIYRAAGHDDEHLVHFGMAKSKDGFHFERCSDEPLFSPPESGVDMGCMEDARIVKFGAYYFITYASRMNPPGKYWELDKGDFSNTQYIPPHFAEQLPEDLPLAFRTNLTSTHLLLTKNFKEYWRAGRMTDPTVDDRDVIIFPEKIGGKFYTLHRPMSWVGSEYGTDFPAIWIAACDDLLEHKQLNLLIKAEFEWECKVGGSTPPLKTADGWLVLYHAVGPDKRYRTGALLLDLDDPTQVLSRTPDWIMEPDMEWENKGFYDGVAFPCGNVIKDGVLYVYYGGGDMVCAVATCAVEELLGYLKANPVKNLKAVAEPAVSS